MVSFLTDPIAAQVLLDNTNPFVAVQVVIDSTKTTKERVHAALGLADYCFVTHSPDTGVKTAMKSTPVSNDAKSDAELSAEIAACFPFMSAGTAGMVANQYSPGVTNPGVAPAVANPAGVVYPSTNNPNPVPTVANPASVAYPYPGSPNPGALYPGSPNHAALAALPPFPWDTLLPLVLALLRKWLSF